MRRLARPLPVAAASLAVAAVLILAATAHAGELAYQCERDICTIDVAHPDTGADLTKTPSDELSPAWSPDGGRIAFTGYYPDPQIYVFSFADPEHAIEASSAGHGGSEAAWSADGSELAWSFYDSARSESSIDFAPSSGLGTPQEIERSSPIQQNPAWSPSGAELAFARGAATYLASPLASPAAHLLTGGIGVNPTWSPDGTRIAAVSASDGTVRLIAADGSGTVTPLPVKAGLSGRAAWSPDGTHVVYVDSSNQVRVAPTDPPGEGFEIKLPPDAIVPLSPSFSPDGTQIAFSAQDNLGSSDYLQLYVAPASGGEAVQLTKTASNSSEPVWKPEHAGLTAPVEPPAGSNPPSAPAPGSGSGSGGAGGSSGSTGSPSGNRKPVTIEFAALRHAFHGELPAVSIACHLGSTNVACHANGEATYVQPITRAGTGRRLLVARKVIFAKGSATVPNGQTGSLRLKLTAAGRKALKPGKKLKLALTVVVSAPGAGRQTATKTITVKEKA